MEPATAADGNFKCKNITVHGNETIIKQTGPKLVYSAEQRKALELITIKYPPEEFHSKKTQLRKDS